MTHSLSTRDIADIVGDQAFSRGERYARNGRVLDTEWLEPGTLLNAGVMGTDYEPYDVTVMFTLNAAGDAVDAEGDCSCPVGMNCKHVAALLIATAAPVVKSTTPRPSIAVRAARAAMLRTPLTSAEVRQYASAFAPADPPAWKSALTPLAKKHVSTPATGTGLALQFELSQPSPARPGVARRYEGGKLFWLRPPFT